MSARHGIYLTCDGCGVKRPTVADDATSARLAAAADGWKYRAFSRKGVRQGTPGHLRAVDTCAECPLPSQAPPIAAEVAQ